MLSKATASVHNKPSPLSTSIRPKAKSSRAASTSQRLRYFHRPSVALNHQCRHAPHLRWQRTDSRNISARPTRWPHACTHPGSFPPLHPSRTILRRCCRPQSANPPRRRACQSLLAPRCPRNHITKTMLNFKSFSSVLASPRRYHFLGPDRLLLSSTLPDRHNVFVGSKPHSDKDFNFCSRSTFTTF